MTQPNASKVAEPTNTRETMTAGHVADQEYPDPNEPSPKTAGFAIVGIIGGIAVVMIIVMIVAFVYFNDFWEGPTSLILPWMLAQ